MGGKGPDGGQWSGPGQSGPTLNPDARQRVEDSQKSVFNMITQLRDSIPGNATSTPTPTPATTPTPTAPVSPTAAGGTEIAEPSQPGGGAATTTPDTSTGGLLATTVTPATPQTPSNFWTALGAKTRKPPPANQT